jgi:hypothetical protein
MPLASGLDGGRGPVGKPPKNAPPPKKSPVVVHNTATNSTVMIGAGHSSSPASTSKNLGVAKGGKSGAGSTGSTSGVSGSGSAAASSSTTSTANAYTQAQKARDNAARDRYVEDAANLQGQIAALRAALGPKGTFRKALTQRLENIKLVRNQQMDVIEQGFLDRAASLDEDAKNNLRAAADSGLSNEMNRVRERTSALSEAAAQGAGESDVLRAQMMSLRNWDANQDGINRAFHDGARSINSARNDLSVDTRTGLANIWTEGNADREQMWANYYNQTSETQTQLGNALGQQGEYYGLAIEAGRNAGAADTVVSKSKTTTKSSASSKDKGKGGDRTAVALGGRGKPDRTAVATSSYDARPSTALLGVGGPDGGRPDAGGGSVPRDWNKGKNLGKGKGGQPGKNRPQNGGGKTKGLSALQDAAVTESDQAFLEAAKTQGKVWENPGLPDRLLNWQPPVAPEATTVNSTYNPLAGSGTEMKRPEGATLRKW